MLSGAADRECEVGRAATNALLGGDDMILGTHRLHAVLVRGMPYHRLHAVLVRGMPYVVSDTDGAPIDPATANQLTQHWIVPREDRAR
jgi:TPP-dependent pyruvate/acetoin dehydrogenase alpha subunit